MAKIKPEEISQRGVIWHILLSVSQCFGCRLFNLFTSVSQMLLSSCRDLRGQRHELKCGKTDLCVTKLLKYKTPVLVWIVYSSVSVRSLKHSFKYLGLCLCGLKLVCFFAINTGQAAPVIMNCQRAGKIFSLSHPFFVNLQYCQQWFKELNLRICHYIYF